MLDFEEENLALHAFARYGDMALREAFCVVGNREDAEDIAQEVFFAMHRHPPEIESEEHLKAYVLRAVINRGRNYRQSRLRHRREPLDEAARADVSEEDFDGDFPEILNLLPRSQAAVLYLHDCEGCTIGEIAQMLGKKENTVGSLLRRGHKKLRETLTEDPEE